MVKLTSPRAFTARRVARALIYRVSFNVRACPRAVAVQLGQIYSRRPIVDPIASFDISLATYGKRLRSVSRSIISATLQEERPARFVLWVQDLPPEVKVPRSLRRLEKRGLEIRRGVEGFGSHNKYLNYVLSDQVFTRSLLLIDDDIYYRRNWLASVLERSQKLLKPIVVSSYCTVFSFDGEGSTQPFRSWPQVAVDVESPLHFFHSGSGTLLPPPVLAELRNLGKQGVFYAPRADDIWLNWVCLSLGIPVAQAESNPRDLIFRPGTQGSGLFVHNVGGGGNDAQLAATYSEADYKKLKLLSR